ncbi:hypothetical protein GSQ34_09735 [Clostridioides difficile]|nr:hypothetical protein [Clostridioides difficile]
MERLMELIERKFLKDVELLELEDIENVIECKMTQLYNAHYNEYLVKVKNGDEVEEYFVYLKHR